MKIGELGGYLFLRHFCLVPVIRSHIAISMKKMQITYLKKCLSADNFSRLAFFLFFCGFQIIKIVDSSELTVAKSLIYLFI